MHLLFIIQLRIQTCYCPVSPEINILLTYLLSLGGSIGMSSGGERGYSSIEWYNPGEGEEVYPEGREGANQREEGIIWGKRTDCLCF